MKKIFNMIDRKTAWMLNSYAFISLILMLLSFDFKYKFKDFQTSFLLVELSLIMLSIGIWGSAFCEFYKKR